MSSHGLAARGAGAKSTILVLGVTGMLGSAVFRYFNSRGDDFVVFGSARSLPTAAGIALGPYDKLQIVAPVDVENSDSLAETFARVRPDVVINCVGVVKQLQSAKDPLVAVPLNTLLPHRLAKLCAIAGARFIHVSTDCVFTGQQGRYAESDATDATDIYGLSKFLGEVDYPHAITLRTSIVGEEIGLANGLVGWFLRQTGTVKGFANAIFSGLPTDELARVIHEYVLPHAELHGVYHVSSAPISKLDLLSLVRDEYGLATKIDRDESLVIDRSLDSSRFMAATGYKPPDWPTLVRAMRNFRVRSSA